MSDVPQQITDSQSIPWWLGSGLRKLVMLGPALYASLAVGAAALYLGKMPPDIFESYTIGVLSWGGGIFAGANVLEHFAKSWSARADTIRHGQG